MNKKEYIVTLVNANDLEQFYSDMEQKGIELKLKRPLSRNTHYMMTVEEVDDLKYDSRIWDVVLAESIQARPQYVNNSPYTITGNFWKDDTVGPATVDIVDRQWGHLHCAGNDAQRRKGLWGSQGFQETVYDSVTVFNDGRDVDVVIVDDPVSYDNEEWYSPTTGNTRFVQYQWFNELNAIVDDIDKEGLTLPTGTITYHTADTIPYYHGVHVCGTACGQFYGWAKEANIYNIATTGSWSSGQSINGYLIFDYLRAFHLNKPINPNTGKRNPTITNHSYGGVTPMPQKGVDGNGDPVLRLDLSDIGYVIYQGVIYNASNPGPSGWTEEGVDADFGVRIGLDYYPSWNAAITVDVIDAINDGVVIIGAAGNDNVQIARPGEANWNNIISVIGQGLFYYNRGAWPNSPDNGAITVGSLSKRADFRRSTFTNFGSGIDVFAPGDNILSTFNNFGLVDSKYTQGSGNYFYPIDGTSMASPQVCGVIACAASGKPRFHNQAAIEYLDKTSKRDDMTFDSAGGGYDDPTCQQGSPNKYLLAVGERRTSGFITAPEKGARQQGMTFPRRSSYFSG
jgi:hypothetical protein